MTALELMPLTFAPDWPIVLTTQQKLRALENRFYQRATWTPRAGDLYTTSRADLDLYQITRIEDGTVWTIYRDPARDLTRTETPWPEDEFLSPETFGYARTHVPNWVFL